MAGDVDRARSALHAIPPDLPRDAWHRVGRAAIAAGLSIDDVVLWSEPSTNFVSERDVRAAFQGITPEGGTGPATLYRTAFDAGWSDGRRRTSSTHTSCPRSLLQGPQRRRASLLLA